MLVYLGVIGLILLFFVGLAVFSAIADWIVEDSFGFQMMAAVLWLFTYFYWLTYFGVIK